MPDLSRERRLGGLVAGVDEAGRGPWAGPVVAAAVILDQARLTPALHRDLNDSKALTKRRREALFLALQTTSAIGVGRADVAEIDKVNILQASLRAMVRAIQGLPVPPDHVLVDGNRRPPLAEPAMCVVGGDRLSLSIAAASIVAKVVRDREMAALAAAWPGYGWEQNAGYGTALHRDALGRLGVTPHHRRSFRPIAQILRANTPTIRNVDACLKP